MSVTVKELVGLFMQHNAQLVSLGKRSTATIKFYNSRFKWLLLFFKGRKWKSIKSLEILEYLEFAGKGRAGSTQRHNIGAINTLQIFARKHGLVKKRIFKDLEKPPMGRREFIPNDSQIDQLLERASVPFRVIHGMLLKSAARPGEACNLQIGEIDWAQDGESGLIVMKHHKTANKTGKPRLIPIGMKLSAVLRTAIGRRSTGNVFLTESGTPWKASHLSSTFRKLRMSAGLPDEYVLYSTRHRAITDIVKEAGIEVARVIAGHRNIAMTQRYSHLDVGELGSVMDKI